MAYGINLELYLLQTISSENYLPQNKVRYLVIAPLNESNYLGTGLKIIAAPGASAPVQPLVVVFDKQLHCGR